MEIIKHTRSTAVLPNEERFISYNCGKLQKIFFGKNTSYDYTDFSLTESGQRFRVKGNEISLESIYEHDALNATIAYAVGELCGLDEAEIVRGLGSYQKSDFRGNIELIGGIEIINDCYNASYESVKSAIINTVNYCRFKRKKVAVLLGDMLELGNKAEEYHRKIGLLCKENNIEKMFVYGRLAKWYLEENPKGITCEKYADITKTVLTQVDDSYVLLIKASNAMNFKKIVDEIRENKNA